MDFNYLFFIINFSLLIPGASGLVISILLYLKNKNEVIKTYFWTLLLWTISQLFYHLFYYFNEVIYYSDILLNYVLNDLTFVFIGLFVYLLMILINMIFNVKLGKRTIIGLRIALLVWIIPVTILTYLSPDLFGLWNTIEVIKGVGLYMMLYFIAFDVNKRLLIIINDDVRKIFRWIFILQMVFYPLMIVESVLYFERIYPFGISVIALFYAVVNTMWLYFVSRYLHLPEIKLISEEESNELNNYFIIYKLTKREKEVTKLILNGLSYAQIAGQLFITLETVKSHVNNIYKKSGVGSKIELSNLVQKCKNT